MLIIPDELLRYVILLLYTS